MTLTELNYSIRRFAPLAIIGLLILIILFFAFQLLFLYVQNNHTASVTVQKLEYNTVFSKINPPIIPQAKSPKSFTYNLDTIDGTTNIEQATSAANIYFIPKGSATFGFEPQIYLMAKTMGFDTDITKHTLHDTTATFDDGKRKLDIDINNFNFTFDFVFTPEDINFSAGDIPSEDALTSEATNILSRINRYPPEIAQGKKNITYFNFNPDTKNLTPLQSPQGANMAEVDFYLPDMDGYPVVTSSYYNSPNYVLFAFDKNELKVVRAKIALLEHSTDQVGIYPIKNSTQAWQEFITGSGYVVSSGADSGAVTIKKIFLAYYSPDVYQQYLQPVYVFLGDNNFVGYLPAVSAEYISAQ